MYFKFIDSRNWKYHFHINEEDLLFINYIIDMGENGVIQSTIPFCDDTFVWKEHHINGNLPLFSLEAKEFCEKKVTTFMRMKAFW